MYAELYVFCFSCDTWLSHIHNWRHANTTYIYEYIFVKSFKKAGPQIKFVGVTSNVLFCCYFIHSAIL